MTVYRGSECFLDISRDIVVFQDKIIDKLVVVLIMGHHAKLLLVTFLIFILAL